MCFRIWFTWVSFSFPKLFRELMMLKCMLLIVGMWNVTKVFCFVFSFRQLAAVHNSFRCIYRTNTGVLSFREKCKIVDTELRQFLCACPMCCWKCWLRYEVGPGCSWEVISLLCECWSWASRVLVVMRCALPAVEYRRRAYSGKQSNYYCLVRSYEQITQDVSEYERASGTHEQIDATYWYIQVIGIRRDALIGNWPRDEDLKNPWGESKRWYPVEMS